MISIFQNISKYLALSLIFALGMILLQGRAHAILPSELDNVGPAQGSSSAPSGRSWFAVGHGKCPLDPYNCPTDDGFEGPRSVVFLYTPVSAGRKLTVVLSNPGGGCPTVDGKSGGSTVFTFQGFRDPKTSGAAFSQSFPNNGTFCGNYPYDINATTGTTYSLGGIRYYRVQLTTVLTSNTAYIENSFRINIISNPSSSYVAMVDFNTPSTSYDDYTGIYQLDSPSKWTQSIEFAPICGGGVSQLGTVSWVDADYRFYSQNINPKLTIVIEKKPRDNTGVWSVVDSWATEALIGNSGLADAQEYSSNFDENFKYKLTWHNVAPLNTIQVKLPFEQINLLDTNCNTTPICTNIPGGPYFKPADLPPGTVYNAATGTCSPPSTNCVVTSQINNGRYLSGSFNSATVQVRNGTGSLWDERSGGWVAYTQNDANGEIKVYGGNPRNPTRLPSQIVPPLPNNQSSTVTFAVDGSTVGARPLSFSVYRFQLPNTRTLLTTCSVNITVYDQPVLDAGFSVTCGGFTGHLSWQARGGDATGILSTSSSAGENFARGITGGAFGLPFDGWPGAPGTGKIRPYLGHDFSLLGTTTDGQQIPFGTASLASCMDLSCTPNALTLEAGKREAVNRGAHVNSQITGTSFGMYASVGNNGQIFNDDGTHTYINTPAIAVSPPGTDLTTNSPPIYGDGAGAILVKVFVDLGVGYFDATTEIPSFSCPGGVLPDGGHVPVTVLRLPYVKAYGSDVVAGGRFFEAGGVCTPAVSGIFAYMRDKSLQPPPSNKSGSGSQLAAFANGDIRGFATATSRITEPIANRLNGLAFGAASTVADFSKDALVGGSLTPSVGCITDYFTETQSATLMDTANPGNVINQGVGTSNKQSLYSGLTTVNGIPNYDRRHTFYVDGDVIIRGNIVYKTPYGTIAGIPNFTLVVKGNIYIDSKVTQLDGTYIAQPKNTNGGSAGGGYIYTCATSAAPITIDTAVYSTCSNYAGGPGAVQRLVVNGAFVAKKVVLNRALNTLNDSAFQESSALSKAAEIFNFTPEVYLSPPVFKPSSSFTSGDYEYVATLPPVL